MKHSKKRKKSRFVGFSKKNVKIVKKTVITWAYRRKVLSKDDLQSELLSFTQFLYTL